MQLTIEEMSDAHFRSYDRAWSALIAVVVARVDAIGGERDVAETTVIETLAKRISRPVGEVRKWLSTSHNVTMNRLGLLAEGLDCDIAISVTPRLTVIV